MFTYQITVKMHDTDAAGILFFGHQFKMMHDAYEAFLEKIGFGFAVLLKEKKYFVPIVHAEADYKQPLFVGDLLTISVYLERVGDSSFSMLYRLKRQGELVGSGKTVHVSIDKKTKKKISLPEEVRKALKKIN